MNTPRPFYRKFSSNRVLIADISMLLPLPASKINLWTKMSTLIQSSNWKSVFLILFAWCLVGSIDAQTVLDLSNDTRANNTDCDNGGIVFTASATYTDGAGMHPEDYDDSGYTGIFFWTFCPDDPLTERVRITFSDFGVVSGDIFRIYDGNCAFASNGSGYIELLGNSVGTMTATEVGTPPNYGSAWAIASCANASGCLTIGFDPNGDTDRGSGFDFTTTNDSNTSDLVCNDSESISISTDCSATITPADILENTAIAGPLTITIDGNSYVAASATQVFNGLSLTEGIHDYILRDDCGNACGGRISLDDTQGPACLGSSVEFITCGNTSNPVVPAFLDCNAIAETNYVDLSFGSCGDFTSEELGTLTDLGFDDITSTNQILADLGSTIGSVTVRSWTAVDSKGNQTEDCLQFFSTVHPNSLAAPTRTNLTVNCGDGTTPEELLTLFQPEEIAPHYTVTIPNNLLPLSESDIILTGAVLPEQNNFCGWITTYTDEIEGNEITRTWQWVDWCAATPDLIEFVQIIEVVDINGPVNVAGTIKTPSGDLVDCVNISVTSANSSEELETNENGTYAFQQENCEEYIITPMKDINLSNGVGEEDFNAIFNHLEGNILFNSPYEYIAADVDMDGLITLDDWLAVLDLSAGFISEFPNNTPSWRFVDASYDFGADITSTLSQDFPEIRTVNNLSNDISSVDFIAVKVGDLDGTAITGEGCEIPKQELIKEESIVKFEIGSLSLVEDDINQIITIPVLASEFQNVAGFGFTIKWDQPNIEYLGFELISQIGGSRNQHYLDNGVSYSWVGDRQSLPNNSTLFEMKFKIIEPQTTNLTFDESALVIEDITNELTRKGSSTSRSSSANPTNLILATPILQNGRITFPADPIPTMSQWGLFIFCLLILNLSVIIMLKKDFLNTSIS